MARRKRRTREQRHDQPPNPLASATEEAPRESTDSERWGFEEGTEIAPGRRALQRLGGGDTYEAYLAWDDTLHATVVVKILRPHVAQNRNDLEHLKREVQTLNRLAHPTIVRCFGAVTSGPRPHLVLEHLEGPRLSTFIRRFGPLPIEQMLPLGLRICSALHYLETQRIVHLDVKPSNIVMSADPRLIDFSIARSWKRALQLTTDVGTRRFMAPEQCLPGERGEVGAPADIWGLGMTMYRAITGESAFDFIAPKEEKDPLLRYPQLTEEPHQLPDEIPIQVREPVMACLASDPAARPAAAALSAALEPLVALLPTARPLGRRRPRL
jgi:eukaryotic-like serine/threonine-protein kinase